MKRFFLISVFLLILSCNETKNVDYAVINGKIHNYKGEFIGVTQGGKFIQELFSANPDGTFTDTIYNLGSKQNYYLYVGANKLPIALEKGTNLGIEIDEKHQNASYKGNDAKKSEYLFYRDSFLSNELDGADTDLFGQKPHEFKTNTQGLFNILKEKLDSFKFDKKFTENQKKWLDYRFIQVLNVYPHYNKNLTGMDNTLPDDFFAEMKNLNFDNFEDYENFDTYEQLVREHFFRIVNDPNDSEQLNQLFKELNVIKSENIRNDVFKALVDIINSENQNSEMVFNYIMEKSNSEQIKKLAKEAFDLAKR